ncbi:MAG: glucodextranase DOMON-like domain-containing protein [Thermoprotei archaeon]
MKLFKSVKRGLLTISTLLLMIMLINTFSTALSISSQQSDKPLYVIFIWHYHQPWYYSSDETYFILPWVRMHSVGNYYKMGYILSKHPSIKVTFTFTGSLLTQLMDYINGKQDIRQIISWKIVNGEKLSIDEKFSMLSIPGGFFDINWKRIVDVVPRYRELRDKTVEVLNKYRGLPEEVYKERVVSEFNDQDFIDLAVLFNLFWTDPMVLNEEYPDLYNLWIKAYNGEINHFTVDDLRRVLEVHMDIMKKIVPLYGDLVSRNQVELIPVPYSHPLAPILADFGWGEDLEIHLRKSIEVFNELFNYTPRGVWPAEQAVNEYVLRIFAENDMIWTVTDESILGKTGMDLSDPNVSLRPWYIDFDGRRIYVFFRNTELSNLISFTYSNWDSKQAAEDLVNRLLEIKSKSDGTNVVVIALDGENPWEWYEWFGDIFLDTLYTLLEKYQNQGDLITITPSEYLELYGNKSSELPKRIYSYLDLAGKDISDLPYSYTVDAYSELPRKDVEAKIAEGSWAGGELAIWIGQRQENAAWMLLAKAREDVLKALNVSSMKEALAVNSDAVEYLLRAEASDWFWWYGGDGGGTFPSNPLFKAFLRKAYELAGLTPPNYLKALFNPEATPVGVLNTDVPKPVEKPPVIDGLLSDDEWISPLNVSVGLKYVRYALVEVTSRELYIAFVPVNEGVLNKDVYIAVYMTTPRRSVSPYHPGYNVFPRYGEIDLGMGLFYEILVKPSWSKAIISAADGRGGWVELFRVKASTNKVIEVAVPWLYLGLEPGDTSYFTIAVYYNDSLVETSTILGMTYQLQVPRMVLTGMGKTVFEMDDPIGDDKGAGTYSYPKADVFIPGVFDMTKFRIVDLGDKLIFEVYVRDLGGNPWSGPNGFCLQYVHIYVHTTLDIPGRTDTFGLNVNITNEHAWHFALLLAPGWGSDPVPEGERAALYYYNNTVIAQDGPFKVYSDPARNAIIAEVSKNLLLDTANIDKWVYIVVLTSYDGYGPARIRPFGVESDVWVVGVGKEHALAVLFNVIPRIMDLLAPTPDEQYSMLSSYTVDREKGTGKPAIIHGYGAITPVSPIITTVTVTTTQTRTSTVTETSILTRIETIEKQVTTTIYTPTTTTITSTSPTTIIETRYPMEYSAIALVIGILLGYLVSAFIRKK